MLVIYLRDELQEITYTVAGIIELVSSRIEVQFKLLLWLSFYLKIPHNIRKHLICLSLNILEDTGCCKREVTHY